MQVKRKMSGGKSAHSFYSAPGIYHLPFVGNGEPFYCETLRYVEKLQDAGIPARVDVYHTNMHAFDMMRPQEPMSREAAKRFLEAFEYAKEHYYAAQQSSEQQSSEQRSSTQRSSEQHSSE